MDSTDKCFFLCVLVVAVAFTISLGLYNYLGTMKDPVAQRISAVNTVATTSDDYRVLVMEIARAPTNSANLEAR